MMILQIMKSIKNFEYFYEICKEIYISSVTKA